MPSRPWTVDSIDRPNRGSTPLTLRSLLLPLAALALALGADVAAARTVLVNDGKAAAAIVVAPRVMAPDEAGEPADQRRRLRLAVADLALYLQKMSGAEVAVVSDGSAPAGVTPIYVAEKATEVFGPPSVKAGYAQGFRLVVSDRGVGLIGESDLAVTYAIYELLHRLGCRWYMPSPMGEVVPSHKTVALDPMDISAAPSTLWRAITYADEDYLRRNRMGGRPVQTNHSLEFRYLTKEELEANPAWVATREGKLYPKRLKWSNPDVANALADRIIEIQAKENRASFSLTPADGDKFDDSPEDQALDAGDFDPAANGISLTDRYIFFVNRVVTRVTAKYPDLLFGMGAYSRYTRPPVREKLHPNVVPSIAPIYYSRAHPMHDDGEPNNKDLRYIIEGWGKAAGMVRMYFYGFFLAEPSGPNPLITKWAQDIPYVYQHNVKLWHPETLRNFETSLPGIYMGMRMAFDNTQDPLAIIDELFTHFYGSAAEPMAAYWRHFDEIWVKTPEYSGNMYGHLRRFTPPRMARARELMDQALAAARTEPEKFRVQMANDSLLFFEHFIQLRRDLSDGKLAHLEAELERRIQWSKDLAEKYREQYAFCGGKNDTRITLYNRYLEAFLEKPYRDASRVARDTLILTPAPLRQWRYQIDPDNVGQNAGWAQPGFDDSAWKTTDPCVETWSSLGLHNYRKAMWYRQSVDLSAQPQGKKVFLWLAATDGITRLYVNGQPVPWVNAEGKTLDEWDSWFKPGTFDITAALKPGRNTIAMMITRRDMHELGTGGLLGPVIVCREKD